MFPLKYATIGYSIFASPGTAGAIYVKFSQAQIYECIFDDNWVSAGTSEASLGGAIAGKSVNSYSINLILTLCIFNNLIFFSFL